VQVEHGSVHHRRFWHSARASCCGLARFGRADVAQGLYAGALAPVILSLPRSACIFAGYAATLQHRGGDYLIDHALAGSAGGATGVLLTNSMELVKCRAQTAVSSTVRGSTPVTEARIVLQVLRLEGLKGLATGLPLTCTRDVAFRGVYFSFYEWACRHLSQRKSHGVRQPIHVSLLAGGAAGVLSWLPVYPVDVLKTHWQTGRRFGADTVFTMFRRGLQVEGVGWLYRGLGPTLVRTWPFNSITCVVYEHLREMRRV